MSPKYKYSFTETEKIHRYGVDIALYDADIPSCNFVYEEVTVGHLEEWYSDVSTYTWFIIEGRGTFVIDDEKIEVLSKDLVVVPPKKRIHYFGTMKMVLCTSPAFDEKNEHHVRDIREEESPYK